MKWVGILRATAFSPNSNDTAIMERVGRCLQERGMTIAFQSETDFIASPLRSPAYFSMARSEAALSLLQRFQDEGAWVVNSAKGVRNCARPVITRLMQQQGSPLPHSWVLNLQQDAELPPVTFPAWLKRGDSCAQQKEDVTFVTSPAELLQALKDFRQRDILSAVLSEHAVGDVVKFYGVGRTSFFHWYYPTLGVAHSKFGLEEINGPAQQYPFRPADLKNEADRISDFSDTPVYGGDAIVDPQGDFKIIDFNDWPSFSRCLDDAAAAIADLLINLTQHSWEKQPSKHR